MSSIIYRTFYVFFVVLEIILIIYIFTSWLPMGEKFKRIMRNLISPILDPIRILLKHSIFGSNIMDLSPIIACIIIVFLQKFFVVLLG